MKKKKITLREWLDTIDVLSEPRVVSVKYHASVKVNFASFNEVRYRINPIALEAPVYSVWIGRGEDGIVITLDPPKQYDIRIK